MLGWVDWNKKKRKREKKEEVFGLGQNIGKGETWAKKGKGKEEKLERNKGKIGGKYEENLERLFEDLGEIWLKMRN